MKTSIILIVSFLLYSSFLAFPGFGQEYIWEPYTAMESTLFNSPNDELNLLRLGNSTLVTRIICGKPQQFILNQQGAITPYRWKPDFLNELSIPYVIMHDSALYFSTPTIGHQQAVLSLYEYKDGVLKQLDTSQKSKYSSQPCMSPDGKTLYFVSNRDGGFGGTDIWYFSKDKNDDSWVGPFSLGEIINTKFDEKNPFLPHPDTLYFSTNMNRGKGGYDIQKAVREDGIWTYPRPVSELNSKWDDSDFMLLNDSIAVINRSDSNDQSDIHWFKKKPIANKTPSYLIITAKNDDRNNIPVINLKIKEVADRNLFRNCIFPSEFQKHDAFMIGILGKRLADISEASITLSNNAFTNTVRELLLRKGVKDEQIIIDKQSTDSLILLTGNRPELFEPFPHIELVNNPEPPSFTIRVEITPAGMDSSWQLFANNRLLKSGTKLPDEFVFIPYEHLYPDEDTLKIHVNAVDSDQSKVSDTIIIVVKTARENIAGPLLSGPNPTIWNCKEESMFMKYLKTHLDTFKGNLRTVELFITDYNANTIEQILQKLLANNEFSGWNFTLTKQSDQNTTLDITRLSISQVPNEQKPFMIPILVK
ncbi:MAG: TolB family protein [Candidatus Kapaibacteriota bacterium]